MNRNLRPTENVTDDGALPIVPSVQNDTARAPDGTEYYLGVAAVFALRVLCDLPPSSEDDPSAHLARIASFIRPDARDIAVKAYLAGFRP
jgi:hypothetical protein